MNFNTEVSRWNMPELNSPLGYPLVILFMAGVAGILVYLFWQWGWLSTEDSSTPLIPHADLEKSDRGV
jgi:magnesium transporter